MPTREDRRTSIRDKAIGTFRFPEAVATLLAVVFEPRTDGKTYADALEQAVADAKSKVADGLNSLVDNSSLRETGRIEANCLAALAQLRNVAISTGAVDVVQRLDEARALCRGEGRSHTTTRQDPEFLPPPPVYVRKGRPAVGRWR
jgi:urease gamma subunit